MSDDSSTRKEANAGPERRRRLFPLSSRSLRDEHGVIRALSLPGVLAMSLLALVVFVGTAAWPGIHDAGAARMVWAAPVPTSRLT